MGKRMKYETRVWQPFQREAYHWAWHDKYLFGVIQEFGRDLRRCHERIWRGYCDCDMATNALSQIADRVRKDIGFRPMHPMDEYTDETCDSDGWYDFYMGLNLFTENHSDTCLTFVVVNSDSPDKR